MKCYFHCDLNNFYASVEAILDPTLRGKAIAVCGDQERRHGIVLAKSEPAKKMGVKTGMPIWEAKRCCPDIIICCTHHREYEKYSQIVKQIYYRYTDLIEPFGIDECWLDITPSLNYLKKPPLEIADEIRGVVKRETGLTISVGVSFNKVFAKLGSDMKKPDATTVITQENFRSVVWPLPASDLLFVGKATTKVLEKLAAQTIGDLAAKDPVMLAGHLGRNAYKLVAMARGEYDEPVRSFHEIVAAKSVGNGTTMAHDIKNTDELAGVVYVLCEEIAFRLRRKGFKGRTVNLSVRDTELRWTGAQETIKTPTNSWQTISEAALSIYDKKLRREPDFSPDGHVTGNLKPGKMIAPIHSLRISVSNLEPAVADRTQLSLFENPEDRRDKLSAAFDKIRRKYGSQSIKFAQTLPGGVPIEIEEFDEGF